MSSKNRKKTHVDLILEFEDHPIQNKETFKSVFKIRSIVSLAHIPKNAHISIGEPLYVRQDFIRRKIFYNGKEGFYDFKQRKYTKKDETE
jgi:hypothetical protein